ncbi:MAG: mechanosensitive ion channel family protein [Rubrobacteraceae bacterium]
MADVLDDLLSTLADFVPRLLGAVVVLLVALVVAVVLRRLMARFLESVGLDNFFEQTGALRQLGYTNSPSRLLGAVLFWGIVLTGVAAALSILGLSSLEATMDGIITLAGRALVALVILIIGVMAAGRLADLVASQAERADLRGTGAFRRVTFVTVVAIAALLAAGQLGLETSLLIILAIVILATIGLVAAISIGQGLVLLSGNIAAGRYVQDTAAVGDVISVNGIEGSVEELGYASITIRSEDGYLHRIPNRTLLENVVRKRDSPAPSESSEG